MKKTEHSNITSVAALKTATMQMIHIFCKSFQIIFPVAADHFGRTPCFDHGANIGTGKPHDRKSKTIPAAASFVLR